MNAVVVDATNVCQSCHRPMRGSNVRKADAPGTVAKMRAGCCQSCARGSVPSKESVSEYRAAVSALDAFIAGRRRRGVPAEGIAA